MKKGLLEFLKPIVSGLNFFFLLEGQKTIGLIDGENLRNKKKEPEGSELVRRVGFEPATPWFVARYSIQLSYRRIEGSYCIAFALKVNLGLALSIEEKTLIIIGLNYIRINFLKNHVKHVF